MSRRIKRRGKVKAGIERWPERWKRRKRWEMMKTKRELRVYKSEKGCKKSKG